MQMLRGVFLLLAVFLASSALAANADKERIAFTRFAPTSLGLFLSDADGRNERPLIPSSGLDYNASFSTDGKWVVFTSERAGSADLYRVHPDGSGLERLTNSPSFDDQAALSPDGQTLAFVSTREGGTANVWLLDLKEHRYTNVTKSRSGNFRPSWSPDGNWIAFTSDRDTRAGRNEPSWELLQLTALYIIHPDGSGLHRLTPLDQFSGSPKWSSDSKHIAFYRAGGMGFSLPAEKKTPQIASIDIVSGVEQFKTDGSSGKLSPQYLDGDEIGYATVDGVAYSSGRKVQLGQIQNPSWSPDAKTIVFTRVLANERNRLRPSFSRDPKFELFLTGYSPAYSPNGEELAITGAPENGGNRTMWIMNADGGSYRKLFDAGKGNVASSPSWSPDGQSIAFGIGGFFRRPVEPGQLAIIRVEGADLHILTQGKTSSGFPSFAPDGEHLVYRVLGDGEQGLRIISLQGGEIKRLTAGHDSFPAWSPKGDRIAFTGLRHGDFKIYTIRPDGSELRKLTDTHGDDAHPSWSTDGKWIVFTSSRMGWKDEGMLPDRGTQAYGDIFVMRADGHGVRQLTDNQWEEGTATWLPPTHAQKLSAAKAQK